MRDWENGVGRKLLSFAKSLQQFLPSFPPSPSSKPLGIQLFPHSSYLVN